MVDRSAVRTGEDRVPPQSASLSLGGVDATIRQYFGLLRHDNVGTGPHQYGTLEGVPGVPIARLDGP